ncbi:MAG: hypothetical protein ACK5PF_03720 [bacterium]|jgi:hypothetical protein
MVIVMSDRIECARCRGPGLPNTRDLGTEPTTAKRSGAMTSEQASAAAAVHRGANRRLFVHWPDRKSGCAPNLIGIRLV